LVSIYSQYVLFNDSAGYIIYKKNVQDVYKNNYMHPQKNN